MKRRSSPAAALAGCLMAAFLFVLAAGCGGSTKLASAADFVGSYTASYSRGAGSVLIHVLEGGEVQISVLDGSDSASPVFYSGSGSTDVTGYTSVSCTSPMASGQIVITGAFVAMGSFAPFFEGDMTFSPSGIKVRGISIGQATQSTACPFVGSWQGSYKLASPSRTQGVLSLTVSADGSLTGVLTDIEQGSVSVTGVVNGVGAFSFSGTSSTSDKTSFSGGFGHGSSEAKMGVGKWSSTAWTSGGPLTLTPST